MITGIILAAATGAFTQEAIYWLGLRKQLDVGEFEAMCRSKFNWLMSLVMILASSLVTFFWFQDNSVDTREALVFGAAVPALFKQLITAGSPSAVRLGESSLRSYLRIR